MHGRPTSSLLLLVVLASSVAGSTAGLAGVGAAETTAGEETPVGPGCDFPLALTDATGTEVEVQSDPERVVALQPSAAQTMWEIGARDEVVGMPVNQYTSDLEGYQRPTNVVAEDDFTVVVEVVVDVSPDLVLAPNVTSGDAVRQLRDAGLTVYHFEEARSIEDVYGKTLLTGQLTGNCDRAAKRVTWMRGRIDRVREAVGEEPRPSVIYPLGGGVVAGSGTFLHEMITTAGGSNLAAVAGISGYGQISAEVIVAEDPQWLVLNDGLPRSAIQMDAYNETTAIREDQVIRVNPNYANQPAPRVVYPIETIARSLYPEAMAEAGGTGTPGDDDGTAATEPPPVTETDAPTNEADEPETGTTAPGQPGFGLVAGFVAVAVALIAAGRTR